MDKNCQCCGKPLEGKYQTKFCNSSCAAKVNNLGRNISKKPLKDCVVCGISIGRTDRKVCSKKCFSILCSRIVRERRGPVTKLSPEEMRKQRPIEGIDKIKRNIEVTPSGCWEWKKRKTSAGYGQFNEHCRIWSAHVYAYSCFNPVPLKGQVVRHMCHNKACCNPDHLKIGTYLDNRNDSIKIFEKFFRPVTVGIKSYRSLREAIRETGIPHHAFAKYLNEDNVFDVTSYAVNCIKGGYTPKVRMLKHLETTIPSIYRNVLGGYYYWYHVEGKILTGCGYSSIEEAQKGLEKRITQYKKQSF